MSEENTSQEVYPSSLTLGKKTIVANINQSKDLYNALRNLNNVYIDAQAVATNNRTQFEIDPNTFRIKLGLARVKHLNGAHTGDIKHYTVYIPTYTVQDTGSGSGSGNTGSGSGTTISGGIKTIISGEGINVVGGSSSESVKISVDTTTIATKDYVDERYTSTGGGTTSGGESVKIDSLEFYEIKELLEVLEVMYDEEHLRKHDTLLLYDGTLKDIIAFSYKFNSLTNIDNLNCIKIKTDLTQINNNVYCVISKCLGIYESGDANYELPTTLFDFIKMSTPLCVSKSPAIIDNGCYVWFFPKEFSLGKNEGELYSVYLITFVNTKTDKWDSSIKTTIKTKISSESSAESKLQFSWDNNIESTASLPFASFCYKKPIGVKMK